MHLRSAEIVVISDVHLGTYGCHAKELLLYLRSIKTETLIINGDFIDAWQFKKKYFPKEHLQVISEIIRMSVEGTKVYYITGNHDDVLRKFSDVSAGSIHLRDKLILMLGGKKHWFFHGDIFDASVLVMPFIAKLGGKGYDWLIRINRLVNNLRSKMGMSKYSFAGKIKSGVKRAVKFIQDFENKAIEVAAEKGYEVVVCGHIHQPQNRQISIDNKTIHYLNSGDWVENLTSLEYKFGKWSIYKFDEIEFSYVNSKLTIEEEKEKNNFDELKTTREIIYEKIVPFSERESKVIH